MAATVTKLERQRHAAGGSTVRPSIDAFSTRGR
jgi:hypothetical protein